MGGSDHLGVMSTVSCRITVVGEALERAQGTPLYASESKKQAEILAYDLMQEKHLNSHVVVDLSVQIAALPWAALADRESVLLKLKAAAKSTNGRWNPQDYTSFMRFVPASQWAQQTATELDDYGCCMKLFQFLKGLGLKYPSEPTFAAMTGFRTHVDSKL